MEVRVRRVLTVLAQFGGMVNRRKVGAVAGYPPSGSSMRKALAVCREACWLADGPDGRLAITPSGLAALGPYDPIPTGKALRDWWLENLPDQRSVMIFRVLVGAGGRPVGRDDVAAAVEYPSGGSSMRKALATLRSHEVIVDHQDGSISAVPELFDGDRS